MCTTRLCWRRRALSSIGPSSVDGSRMTLLPVQVRTVETAAVVLNAAGAREHEAMTAAGGAGVDQERGRAAAPPGLRIVRVEPDAGDATIQIDAIGFADDNAAMDRVGPGKQLLRIAYRQPLAVAMIVGDAALDRAHPVGEPAGRQGPQADIAEAPGQAAEQQQRQRRGRYGARPKPEVDDGVNRPHKTNRPTMRPTRRPGKHRRARFPRGMRRTRAA